MGIKLIFVGSKFIYNESLSEYVVRKVKQKCDFVESIRGRDGGYKLSKSASQIMVDDILNLFNDSIKDEQCVLGIGFCNGLCKCALHDQWMEPKLLMQKMFRESSLKDIAGVGCKI